MSTPCVDGELKHENLVSSKLRMVKCPNEKDGKVRVSLSFLSFFFNGGNFNCITLFDTKFLTSAKNPVKDGAY